jgi:hypothetical protein
MGFRRIPALLLLILGISLLGGCAAIPMASTHEDLQAKRFAVWPDKASIYVYRNQSFGFAFPMTLELAGHATARTVGQTYVVWEVEPGAYELTSYAEDTSTVRLNTEPGKAYYIWQEVKVGLWKARTALHQVDEDQGRKGVLQCRLGKSES